MTLLDGIDAAIVWRSVCVVALAAIVAVIVHETRTFRRLPPTHPAVQAWTPPVDIPCPLCDGHGIIRIDDPRAGADR